MMHTPHSSKTDAATKWDERPARDSDAPLPPSRPFHVMVVDDEPEIPQLVARVLEEGAICIHEAATLEQARRTLERQPIDLVLLDAVLPDGDGLDLAAELERRQTHWLLVTAHPDLSRAVRALRLGAVDFLTKPFDLDQLATALREAMRRHTRETRQAHRTRRLRALCRRLNHARHEVSDQVSSLCDEVVEAYQELAEQAGRVELRTEFRTLIEDELDLEPLLRRVLEFFLRKLGPCNTAIFLPDPFDGYGVGGYANHGMGREPLQMLLDDLCEQAIPRIAHHGQPLHLTDAAAVERWCGDTVPSLADHHVIALPCVADDDVLGVLFFCRAADEPFDAAIVDAMSHLGPLLGRHLMKVIRIHHRLTPDAEDVEETGGEVG